MASSVCCVVYASQPKLRVQSSLASWMAWRLRIWLVPASRSQVTFPSQAGALTRLVAPPSVAISARMPSMADCRVCRLLRSPAVAKGLESEDLRVVPVEAGVLQGLSGLVGRLGQVGQKRRGNPLVHVGRRLPGGQVDGQLVHHGLQRISCCYAGQSGVVGGSDATVHRCSGRVIGQLQVHGGRRALSVDFALEGVQGGLVGLGRQALSQAGVDSHEAGSIGQDGSLCCGEVCSQSVRG